MRNPVKLRLDAATRRRLDKLAKATARSRTVQTPEAIPQFVEINDWQVTAIQKGVDAADRGQFIEHARLKSKNVLRGAPVIIAIHKQSERRSSLPYVT